MSARRARWSPQSRAVLRALGEHQAQWQHGYGLSRVTGLKSGTLYPLLIRLADLGLLETMWEPNAPEGRPRRHLYRLSFAGAELADSLPNEPALEHGQRSTTRPAIGQG